MVAHPLPRVKPGTVDERSRARVGAARMVTRNRGDANDLRFVPSALNLWPDNDLQGRR